MKIAVGSGNSQLAATTKNQALAGRIADELK